VGVKFCNLWEAFFQQVIISQVVVIGVVDGLNIGVLNGGGGSGKTCNKKQTCHPPRKYRVQDESVLDQQSISGKII